MLEKDFGKDLPEISVEKNRLQDTLENIISNAVDAIPQNGTIKISSKIREIGTRPYVEIAISDTGTGIPSKALSKIFDLFYTTKNKGLGLGLWRDKTFIEGLGGEIEIESEEGKGSTFTVKIPFERRTA